MSRARVFGVLVTYRRSEQVARRLEQLAGDDFVLDLLIVVDHSLNTASVAAVEQYGRHRKVRHIDTRENLGPAGGFALGLEVALQEADDDDWLVTLSDDDVVHRSFFADLLSFAEDQLGRDRTVGAVGLVGARYRHHLGTVARLRDAELDGVADVDYLGGNQWPMYRAGALRTAGVHRPDLFFGFEELEQGLRLRRSGFRLLVPGPLLLNTRAHFGLLGDRGRRTKRSPDRAWRTYYSVRNLVVIAREFGGPVAPLLTTVRAGVVAPLILFAGRQIGSHEVALAMRGAGDAWRGRMGRRLEPAENGHT